MVCILISKVNENAFFKIHLDAEDRLNKANDDLKRVTGHIEQERAINKAVQRKQVDFFR